MWTIFLAACAGSPAPGKDSAADTADTAIVEDLPWTETPFTGDPRACA
ncbi:MAG: hypothetical protein FJ090_01885 [Deltaproteobacteria bacterium]|nr:hypothetical protein [Deltaproteobacteria bacterium]MBM4389847.1 hypothetical protein [Deltaproteobacteria bacterium]